MFTGETKEWYCTKGYLSEHMLEGEIAKKALALVLSAWEYEVREHFTRASSCSIRILTLT